MRLSVRHAHYSGVLSPFGKPEVSLEPYRQWHAIFQVSKNFTRVFTQFHAIFTQFGLFQPFLGQFQHVGYQNACTRAEKFIGGIGRGHRPQEGAEGPKEEAEGLQTGPKAP